jgi:hypothetical protein
LSLEDSCWPKELNFDIDPEDRCEAGIVSAVTKANPIPPPLLDLTRYSSWSKPVRVLAWILRAAARMRKKPTPDGALNTVELRSARLALIRQAQVGFGDAPRSAKIRFATVDGIIRLQTRLANAAVDSGIKEPVALAKKSAAATLLMTLANR